MRTLRAVASLLALVGAIPGCSAPAPDAASSTPDGATSSAHASPWYREARALDLTGDGQMDTVRIQADGTRADSVEIVLFLMVDGKEKHRESWVSGDELSLIEPTLADPGQGMNLLRARLDTILAGVKGAPFDAPGVGLMAEDSAVMASIDPRPTFGVSISFGFETTVRLAWDGANQRFVRLFSCC